VSEITLLNRGRNVIQDNRQYSVTAKRRHVNHPKITMAAFCRLLVLTITVTAKMTLFAVTISLRQ
jgi:hypothetical protein